MLDVFKKTPIIRIVCFFVILIALIIPVQNALLYRDRKTDNSSYQIINFYKEKKDSLNPVFIGSSNCFAFYSPLLTYNSYGLKSNNYSSSGMGMIFYKYAIEEVKKTQEDALIVLTITPLDIMNYTALHYLLDDMPWSMNKLNFIKRYFTYGDESILNSIEYFFPLMRLHERWSDIKFDDLIKDDGTKGATAHEYYLTYVNDITDKLFFSDVRNEMPDTWKDIMSDLLDYCDDNKVNIVFLVPPRSFDEEEYTQLNSLLDYISSRNFDVMDLREKAEEIGLDFTCDYYDKRHTNIHGSIKYSDYVINKLNEKYNINLVNERNPEWDKAFDNYYKKIKPYIIDNELNMTLRDYHLDKPKLLSLNKTNGGITLLFSTVENADGYIVYRKDNNEWVIVGESNTDQFIDKDYKNGVNTYTVLSYRNDNGKKVYGNYDYKGISVEVKE